MVCTDPELPDIPDMLPLTHIEAHKVSENDLQNPNLIMEDICTDPELPPILDLLPLTPKEAHKVLENDLPSPSPIFTDNMPGHPLADLTLPPLALAVAVKDRPMLNQKPMPITDMDMLDTDMVFPDIVMLLSEPLMVIIWAKDRPMPMLMD